MKHIHRRRYGRAMEWLLTPNHKTYMMWLVAFAIVTHTVWFKFGTTLFHSDWPHWSHTATQQAWQSLGTWSDYFGLGQPRIQIGFTLVQSLWSLITHLGASYDTAVKLSLLIPIAILGFIAPYLTMRKLIGVDSVAFVSALFYGTTPYFLLRQRSHLPIAMVYALTPFIFMAFVSALESMRAKRWLVFLLLYSLGLCLEIRIMYIVTMILLVYTALFFTSARRGRALSAYVRMGVLAGAVLLGLNAFWLLPTMLGGAGSTISQTAGRGLFGNTLFDLPHAFVVAPAGWSGSTPDETFTMQPVVPVLWLIPLLAFIPLVLRTKLLPSQRRLLVFFLITALLGIFLTKQVVPPLTVAYAWLYANFPGFSLFREASKFYLLSAWGYMGLLALGLVGLRPVNRLLFRGGMVVLVGIAVVNVLPALTGSMGGLFSARTIPPDYARFNKTVASQPDMSRVLWVPADPRWGYFDQTHPRASAASLVQQEWKQFVDPGIPSLRQRLQNFFEQPYADNILDASSVRYVAVPLRDQANEDDLIKFYGDDPTFYTDFLDTLPWLKRVNIGAEELMVYENTAYSPHIGSAANLFSLPNEQDIGKGYQLNRQTLKKEFAVNIKSKDIPSRGTGLSSIASDPRTLDIKKGGVTVPFTANGAAPQLYANANRLTASYKVANGSLELFTTRGAELRLSGKPTTSTAQTERVGSVELDSQRRYYVSVGPQIVPASTHEAEHHAGVVAGPLRLLSADQTNLIPNSKFEKGLWKKDVDDCNPHDTNAMIGMELGETPGEKILQLYAGNHSACTGPPAVPAAAGKEYLLRFDYQVEDGDEAAYSLTFNDPKRTTLRSYPYVKYKTWGTIHRSFTVPAGASNVTIQLMGLPNTHNGGMTTASYKNLSLTPLTIELAPSLDLQPRYTPLPLAKGKNVFEYRDAAVSGDNLVPNPSLEHGLWQKKVDDCNSYDERPQLRMQLSPNASDGKQSLELASKRHIACTWPGEIRVKENTTYLLSFDHQSPNTDYTSYSINFDDPNRANTSLYADEPTDREWQKLARIIKTPPGARTLRLSLRSRGGEAGGKYLISRYDNFKLVEMPEIQNQYFVVEGAGHKLERPQRVSYTFEHSAKKLAHVRGAKQPFYLTMSETYHPAWRLELNNAKVGSLPGARPDKVARANHVKWQGFLNAWYVDPAEVCAGKRAGCTRNPDGSYNIDMVIEFTAQRWYYVGVLVSALSVAGCAGYLVFAAARRNRGRA